MTGTILAGTVVTGRIVTGTGTIVTTSARAGSVEIFLTIPRILAAGIIIGGASDKPNPRGIHAVVCVKNAGN